MSANSFGHNFKITSFGESHGSALGVTIEGCPAGVEFDEEILNDMLERRRPGRTANVSGRNESDKPEILSGLFEGKTLGTPIAVIIRNQDAKSEDYDQIKAQPRAGHADDIWKNKFGHSDHRGGGRSSGRETVARVIGGAFAKMMMKQAVQGIEVNSFPRQIGPIVLKDSDYNFDFQLLEDKQLEVDQFLEQVKAEGQSYGGIGEVWVEGSPLYLGQPVFKKLKADLAGAMLSIGATTAFELGPEWDVATTRGTDFHLDKTGAQYGGIRGGVSTGEKILFRTTFKPTSSILDVAKKGRHDPCIVLRAVVVMEAMTWLVLADHYLWSRLDKISTRN